MDINISLQLHSVRNSIEGNLPALLEKVSKIGYKGVEFAGFFDTSAKLLASSLNSLGLTAVASHVAVDKLQDDLSRTLDFHAEIGVQTVVVPWYKFESQDDYSRLADQCAIWAEQAKKYGMGFAFHNHASEISDIYEGRRGIDILLEASELVGFQADVYWIAFAEQTPEIFLQGYRGRCPVIHLKDMKDTKSRQMIEVGDGIINMAGIIAECATYGTTWFSVEQDKIIGDELESIARSLSNLHKISAKL